MNSSGNVCKCSHHSVVPVFVILLGVTFLLGALAVLTPYAVSIIWPILVILGGIAKMTSKKCKCCSSSH